MKIYDSRNISELKNIPTLDDGQIYIYVMLNYPSMNIKIGQTTNIIQRLQSLSGSNCGGNKIIKLALSDSTYVINSESAFHNKFDKYRIEGTEWFDGKYLNFEEVVQELDSQFKTNSYKICNQIRKEIIEKEREKLKQKQELQLNQEESNIIEKPKRGRKKKNMIKGELNI